MKKFNRYLSIILTIFILSSQILTYDSMAETTSTVIYIATAEDLIEFSKDCTLDIFSGDKIVMLTKDIDLSNTDFETIPSFSGIFNGNNHTIRGFNSYSAGSNQGLFRYLQEDGIIKDLHVEGNVKPSGSKLKIGGIIGTNKGQIYNCSFKGEVKGITSIGGIVGYNDKTGSIINCSSYGLVIGEHYTGGIVGRNVGFINDCTNNSEVNTTDDAIPNNDMASYSIKNMDVNQINSTENVNAQTDTGGIVGYNQGIIKSSINRGAIGYQHVGYNIGGIVGRQSGFVSDCKNYGIVNGRKDVAGVAGQAEPFIRLLFSEDTLQRIDKELGVLNDLTQELVNDGDQSSQIISNRLESLNALTTSASNKTQDLMNNTTDYVDESTSTINTGMDRIRDVMSQLEPVVESFVKASDELTNGFNELEKGFDELAKSSAAIENSVKDLDDALDEFDEASESANAAFDKISVAMKKIEQAAENSEEMKEAINDLIDALEELQLAAEAGNKALKKVADALKNLDDPLNADWDAISEEIQDELETMSEHMNSAIPEIIHALTAFADEFEKDQKLIEDAFSWMALAMQDLRDFSEHMNDASEEIHYALNDLKSASSSANVGMKDFSKGMGHFSNASDECSNGLSDIESIIGEINDYEKLQLPKLNDYITESSDSLFEELRNISNELSLLNREARGASDTLFNNLRSINKQFEKIVDIVREGLNAISFDNEDLFEDISDQTLLKEPPMEKGTITNCYNEGKIFGDVNVGGIAGSMAIEYDFDPEDDILNKGNQSFNFKYQTKSLLISSVNHGEIQAKKDYAGGIVGKMDLGLITTSENYGSVENLDGDYTGGIAGSSSSVIRKCYSLSELSGRDYVGGIAGYATNIYDCFSLINVNNSNEFTGAIAGDISGEFKNNYFVEDKWEGVDGISYGGKAMPQSYESFILNENLPKSFKSFQLTYIADNHLIKIIPFEYGESLDLDNIPEVPKKEGYYGNWPPYNYDKLVFSKKLEAVYTPMIQVLSSNPDYPHPKLLVVGSFEPDDTLTINKVNSSNDMVNNETKIEEWSIQLNTAYDKPLTYRFLKPESNKQIILYQRNNNGWQQIKTTEDGSYLLFESDLSSFNIAVVEKHNNVIVYCGLGFLIIGITTILLFIIKKKKKGSKKL